MTIDRNRMNKKCGKCNMIKGRNEFYRDSNRSDLMSAFCKPCTNKRNSEWREANPHKAKESQRGTRRKLEYGLSKEEYNCLIEQQEYLCCICKCSIDNGAAVDHCHSSGKIRGILCRQCNSGLGLFKDNIVSLQNAIDYLILNNDLL